MTRTGPNMTSDADPVADPRSSALATAEACSASPAFPPKLNRYFQNLNNPHIAHIQLFVVLAQLVTNSFEFEMSSPLGMASRSPFSLADCSSSRMARS